MALTKAQPLKASARNELARPSCSAETTSGTGQAFEAVRRLRASGQPGLAVCSKSAEVPELAQEADLVVDEPEGIAGLLAGLASELDGQT